MTSRAAPSQADLTYRGYRASGLLGASQGLSVYLDGVRINEPFGDVINWDMVPEFALQSLTVLPWCQPQLRPEHPGRRHRAGKPWTAAAPKACAPRWGSAAMGRKRADVGLGQRHADGWHSYVGGTVFDENGWL